MSITIEIDETTLKAAEQATNMHDPNVLIRYLLEREIRLRGAQQYLAEAGGTMPDLDIPPRRRTSESA